MIVYFQIRLVNIRSDEIVDGNPKLTLGLVWTIILHYQVCVLSANEPPHNKTNKVICVPSEDSDQPGPDQSSLIRVFPARMKKLWVLSYPLNAQQKLRSDWADAQAELSFR